MVVAAEAIGGVLDALCWLDLEDWEVTVGDATPASLAGTAWTATALVVKSSGCSATTATRPSSA